MVRKISANIIFTYLAKEKYGKAMHNTTKEDNALRLHADELFWTFTGNAFHLNKIVFNNEISG